MSRRTEIRLPEELKREAQVLAKQQGISLNQFILSAVIDKVRELKSGLDDPNFPGITYRLGASGMPVPVLRGTGIRVQTIVISSREWNESTTEIAAQYGLSEGQIKETHRFYRAHQAEVDLVIQSDTRLEFNND
jgi:uncharacterized protein (DUF433 family)